MKNRFVRLFFVGLITYIIPFILIFYIFPELFRLFKPDWYINPGISTVGWPTHTGGWVNFAIFSVYYLFPIPLLIPTVIAIFLDKLIRKKLHK